MIISRMKIKITKSKSYIIGDGIENEFIIHHQFGSNVIVYVRDKQTNSELDPPKYTMFIEKDKVILFFHSVPEIESIKVLIIG